MPYRNLSGMSIDDLKSHIEELRTENKHLKEKLEGRYKTKRNTIFKAVIYAAVICGAFFAVGRQIHKTNVANDTHNEQTEDDVFAAGATWVKTHNAGKGTVFCDFGYAKGGESKIPRDRAVPCSVRQEETKERIALECYANAGKCFPKQTSCIAN